MPLVGAKARGDQVAASALHATHKKLKAGVSSADKNHGRHRSNSSLESLSVNLERIASTIRPSRVASLTVNTIAQLYQGSSGAFQLGSYKYMLYPGSSKLLAWEVVSFCMLMYTAVTVPFQLAFIRDMARWDPTRLTTYFETVVDLFFLSDIVRNLFFTAYYDRGNLIWDRRRIACNYARTWLVVDVVASIPIDWFIGSTRANDEDSGQVSEALLLLRLSKLWKLLRLLRLWRVGLRSKLDSDTYLAEVVITVAGSASFWYIASASTVYLAVHVNGCLQFFAACLDTTAACFDDDAVIEEGGSWVVRAGLNGKSVDEQYMGAMVHALLQMLLVGPGLVTPARSDEYLLYFVSLLVGCFSLIYLIASLTARHVSALSGSQVRPPLCSFVAGIASIASATLSTHLRAPGRVQAPR